MPKTVSEIIREEYKKIIEVKYSTLSDRWPILAGYNIINGYYKDYIIVIFKDTGIQGIVSSSVISFSSDTLGVSEINETNTEAVKLKLTKDYGLMPRDSVVIFKNDGSNLGLELQKLLQRHEVVMGVVGMKIFLSHKGIDKKRVREYQKTLELIGFEPWLDEDSMNAGAELERGIRQGFTDSCAAIFFITPNFLDEDYLASEVNYAIAEKRKKKEKFSIIILVFEENGVKGNVPQLLEPYVWKEPKTDLEAIREIIKALPLQIGNITYKV
jgi:hypothetical protein